MSSEAKAVVRRAKWQESRIYWRGAGQRCIRQERMLSGKDCHKRGGMESEDVFRGERCRKSEMERENVLRGESCNKSEIGRDNILRGGTGCWR